MSIYFLSIDVQFSSSAPSQSGAEFLWERVTAALSAVDQSVVLRHDGSRSKTLPFRLVSLIDITVDDHAGPIDAVIDVAREAVAETGAVGWNISLFDPTTSAWTTEQRRSS